MKCLSRTLTDGDVPSLAHDIQQTLGAFGYRPLHIAASAEEAIARASELCPDVVLMDIEFKGAALDGIETAKLLQQRFDVPIVYMTTLMSRRSKGPAKPTLRLTFSSRSKLQN